ncbi:hypothetical protein JCM10908_007393 [Rhodotorula pacifica]|uniref:uncharacterized protein n=1 Tax=Rhodotorula pacifica TaxID=1495444 RepID=UPI00317BB738
MLRGGIPPEVADEILDHVKDDLPTLLSCCRASKGLCARVQPLLYKRLDFVYQADQLHTPCSLSRSSAFLLDTLYTRPELARLCTDLRLSWRRKLSTDLVRLRTEPTAETIRELFECLPNVLRFELAIDTKGVSCSTPLEQSVIDTLRAWTGWLELRAFAVPYLSDALMHFVMGRPELVDLRCDTAMPTCALPAGLVPPFHLKRLEIASTLDTTLFRIGTSTSYDTLTRLTVPFLFDVAAELAPFRNLRHLCLEFRTYGWNSLERCHQKLDELKAFFKDDSRIETLAFSHARGHPRSNRIRTVRSALPRNLKTLILHPWRMYSKDAIKCVKVGMRQHLWPMSLKKLILTPASVNGPWTDEEVQQVRDKCLEHSIAEVEMIPWRAVGEYDE